MSISLQKTPTSNTIPLTTTFFLGDRVQAVLNEGQVEVLTFMFDRIGKGNSRPLSMYKQQIPGNFNISPGNIAFFEYVDRNIALRYGTQGGKQQSILFIPDWD